jgi:hypothetical protein
MGWIVACIECWEIFESCKHLTELATMAVQKLALERMCWVLVVVISVANAELVDIRPYYSMILDRHNDLRKSVNPTASDMREMVSHIAISE